MLQVEHTKLDVSQQNTSECLGKQKKRTASQSMWLPPDQDVLKFNIDGSFTPGHSHSGWGVVARDFRGEVVAATAGHSEHISSAFHAELIAAVQAVKLAESLGSINIALETDSQLLMLALNRPEVDSSPLGVIINDLKFQLRTSFYTSDVRFCKREFNMPAHEHARIGWTNAVNRALLWEFEVPIAGLLSGEIPQ
jgi:ribonuclease HI